VFGLHITISQFGKGQFYVSIFIDMLTKSNSLSIGNSIHMASRAPWWILRHRACQRLDRGLPSTMAYQRILGPFFRLEPLFLNKTSRNDRCFLLPSTSRMAGSHDNPSHCHYHINKHKDQSIKHTKFDMRCPESYNCSPVSFGHRQGV
jgi:hypothetical protein